LRPPSEQENGDEERGCGRRPKREELSKKISSYTPSVKAGHRTMSEVATVMAAAAATPGPPDEHRAEGPAAQSWQLGLFGHHRRLTRPLP
jgi:hypothetical protein